MKTIFTPVGLGLKANNNTVKFSQRFLGQNVLSQPAKTDAVEFSLPQVRFGKSYPTQFSVSQENWRQADADVLVVPIIEHGNNVFNAFDVPQADTPLSNFVGTIDAQYFEGHRGDVKVFYVPQDTTLNYKKVVLVGLGQVEKDPGRMLEAVKNTMASALKHSEVKGETSLAMGLELTSQNSDEVTPAIKHDIIRGVVAGTLEATYRTPGAHKLPASFEEVTFIQNGISSYPVLPENTEGLASREAILRGAVGEAKDWANAHYDENMTAQQFAQEMQQVTNSSSHLKIVENQADIAWIKDNLPGLYQVSRGSQEADPPRFIKMTYTPPNADDGEPKKKIALIGKSVMHDTGGIQNKGANQNGMDQDMAGGAYVLGMMKALGQLKPENIEVTAYFAMTPNSVSERAYNPGTVYTARVGKKVLVGHTDAEGRLTLIDKVTMAAEEKPDMMMTFATLTGAAANATGGIALMANNRKGTDVTLVQRVQEASKVAGEEDSFTYMPVIARDFQAIATKELDNADIRNAVRDARGGQTAGAFVMSGLPEDAQDIPLLHFDIAGETCKGPDKMRVTGNGMRTVLEYLTSDAVLAG